MVMVFVVSAFTAITKATITTYHKSIPSIDIATRIRLQAQVSGHNRVSVTITKQIFPDEDREPNDDEMK